MPNKQLPILEIQNLTSGYPSEFLINDVNLGIEKGSLTGIIGPNGAGKTTLFRSIVGNLPMLSGEILLNGKPIRKMGHREKARHLAIVTQDIETVDITLLDYVLMGRYPYHRPFQFFETKRDYEIAEEFLKLTDTWHLRHKNLSQISGGERQLAAMARALTQQPSILLLDEPTSHLDITHQVQLLNLIQRLNEQLQLTVIMIIHDLNLSGEYCDQLILMNQGRIHTTGPPNKVLTYQHIEDVYQTVVITRENPISHRPAVFLVSDRVLNQKSS